MLAFLLILIGLIAAVTFIGGIVEDEPEVISVGVVLAILWLMVLGIGKAYEATHVVNWSYAYVRPELVVRSSNATFVISGTTCQSSSAIEFYTASNDNIFFEVSTGYNEKKKAVSESWSITVGKPHQENLERPEP